MHGTADLAAELAKARAAKKTIGLVPTMGALHEGHISLVRLAHQYCDFVVVSIFVNPLQFGVGEDFDRYPRSLATDAAKLSDEAAPSVDRAELLFAPGVEDIYPDNNRAITQHAREVGELFEGAARPGHFDGMLTVVARLFDLVQPNVAVFGAKDAQQLHLVRQLAAREYPTLRIIAAPTVRSASGLALSSRNQNLDPESLELATALPQALRAVARAAEAGNRPSHALRVGRTIMANAPTAKLDYLAAVDAKTFQPIDDSFAGEALLLIAAEVAGTRLIDNLNTTFQEHSA